MRNLLQHLLTAYPLMKNKLLSSGVKGTCSAKLENSGWKALPAVTEFKVNIGSWNDILLAVGILKREDTTLEYRMDPANKRMNRYMKHQIRRILKINQSNRREASWIAWKMISRSTSFRLSAFNSVMEGWYFNMSERSVFATMKKVDKIIRNWDDNLKYMRVYIPKGDTYRPLGVPSVEWRIVLHMWNNMIQLLTRDLIKSSQHGYIPGRGTMTCWQEVLDKAINSKNIYEYDLKGFFDSVQLSAISQKLEDHGIPPRIKYYLENINLSTPELPEEELLDESAFKEKIEARQWKAATPSTVLQNIVTDFVQANGVELLKELMKEDDCETVEEWAMLQWSLLDEYNNEPADNIRRGVPQGAPTSPFLAIMVLADYLPQNSISYADDFIIYGDSEEDVRVKSDKHKGIIVNEEKSGWIKKDGIWLKDLKFLGLTYNGETKELTGTTRNGGLEVKGDLKEVMQLLHSNEDWIISASKTSFFGWLVSYMYSKTEGWKRKQPTNLLLKSVLGCAPFFGARGSKTLSSTAIRLLTKNMTKIVSRRANKGEGFSRV